MSEWCMYKVVEGKVTTGMFLPDAIPDGWYDSPGAAKEGGIDWVTSENNRMHEEANHLSRADLEEMHQSQNDRQATLVSRGFDLNKAILNQELASNKLDERERVLKKREAAIKIREDSFKKASSAKVVKTPRPLKSKVN